MNCGPITNTITATFDGLRVAKTRALYQYDYGQQLLITGIDLPVAYEVHFATSDTGGNSITQIGDADGVIIPDSLLLLGVPLYAFIYLHTDTEDGETVYQIVIPVKARPAITNQEPTPVQQDAITQAIAALNAAVDQTTAENVQKAQEAQSGAETAQAHAEDAQRASEAAQTASETAQAGAEAAQTAAETAQGKAETAQDKAEIAQDAAEDAAERAEQSASQAGYMFFDIDEDGHLIYQRTTNTQVDFYLEGGHLFVEAIA